MGDPARYLVSRFRILGSPIEVGPNITSFGIKVEPKHNYWGLGYLSKLWLTFWSLVDFVGALLTCPH